MTRNHVVIGIVTTSFSLLIASSAFGQTPPPAPPPPAPAPTVTVLQPVTQPPAPPPAQPAQPNVVIVQPTQPAQPLPPPQPVQPPPTVYVYDLPPHPSYAYGAPPPPPPPPPKPKKRTDVHNHDGFYLRLGIGAAALALGNERRNSESDTTLSTGGAAVEFGMGGTIGEGFVLGGRVIAIGGENLKLESANERQNVEGSLGYATLQLFADWYLDPESGLHLEGALGPASVTYDPTPDDHGDEVGDDMTELEGFGGSLGVGLEGWVGEQWSLGGLLRLNWAAVDGTLHAPGSDRILTSAVDDEEDSGTVIAVAPMLMLTGTFH